MPKIDVELSIELIKAIKDNKGTLSMSEFIEMGLRAHMKPKITLDREGLLKKW